MGESLPLPSFQKGQCVLYRQENVDGIGAQDALQTVINTAAMTAEWKTPTPPSLPVRKVKWTSWMT